MNIKNILMIVMAIIIILLLLIPLISQYIEAVANKYGEDGYKLCQQDITNTIINNLQTKGYVPLVIGNQTINLVIYNGE